MLHKHWRNPRTLGATQRLFLAVLRDTKAYLSIPAIGRLLGMASRKRELLYRAMKALCKRGLVLPLVDPRNDTWTVWDITDAGIEALHTLGV